MLRINCNSVHRGEAKSFWSTEYSTNTSARELLYSVLCTEYLTHCLKIGSALSFGYSIGRSQFGFGVTGLGLLTYRQVHVHIIAGRNTDTQSTED